MPVKTYTKSHSNSKAFAIHVSKIKKRGGSVATKKQGKTTKITYSFSKNKQLQMF